MKRIITVSTILIFLISCVAIKPNTMTDEELKEAANVDCRQATIKGAVVGGVLFLGIGAIPLYFAAAHQCPENKELAIKELETRKLDSIKKEAVEPKEQLVSNVEGKLSHPDQDKKIVTVVWTAATIRSGAGNDYPVVTSVNQGDKLTVIAESGEWFNVQLDNKNQGWISNKVVK